MDAGASAEALGGRRRGDGAGRRARPHRRPHRPRLDPRPAQRDGRRPGGVDPPPRGRRGRLDQRARPRPAAGDVHPRVGALPAGRPPGGAGGLRAHRRRGPPRRAGVVGLRARRPRDGGDDGLRDGRLGPRAASVADHTADVAMPSWAAASIDAAVGAVLAGPWPGDVRRAARRPPAPWWAEEGRMAVQSGVAALDVLGRDGDVDADARPARRAGRLPARAVG